MNKRPFILIGLVLILIIGVGLYTSNYDYASFEHQTHLIADASAGYTDENVTILSKIHCDDIRFCNYKIENKSGIKHFGYAQFYINDQNEAELFELIEADKITTYKKGITIYEFSTLGGDDFDIMTQYNLLSTNKDLSYVQVRYSDSSVSLIKVYENPFHDFYYETEEKKIINITFLDDNQINLLEDDQIIAVMHSSPVTLDYQEIANRLDDKLVYHDWINEAIVTISEATNTSKSDIRVAVILEVIKNYEPSDKQVEDIVMEIKSEVNQVEFKNISIVDKEGNKLFDYLN